MNIFKERNSIRKFDTTYKISDEELALILEESYRAPSSMNLQSVRLFSIASADAKAKLQTVLLGNELQLTTASHMILIAFDKQKFDNAHKIFDKAVSLNLMPQAVRDQQLANFETLKKTISQEKLYRDGYIDGGLFAMQLMLVAKTHGLDTCPIGGFKHDQINEALNLDQRYVPVLMIALGKRDEEGFKSVRLDIKDVLKFL